MKLENAEGSNYYYVSHKKGFAGIPVPREAVQTVIDFAYEMCFGAGHHRNCRTGGQYERKGGEKFCNTFQGKLAEIVLYNYFKSEGLEVKEPDFGIYKEGIWDDSDLEIQGKKINVKSAASQSNLLLLETKDWNAQAQYIPNILLNNGSAVSYDYFILVRIEPDIKKLFKTDRLLFSNEISRKTIDEILFARTWNFDIAGYCTNADVITTIANNYILPQNAMLNQYTKMDACNYYIQSGDMKCIKDLVQELKAI
ncbi:hypothetical protein [Flavobacterium aquicola]|uniref:Restriction endonuclease n=1 Tax=Flavobacterium aquicola TaxID=1682742 RepID=A0A3E0EV96_9FLAO|nr:hypothetical protein [Flavobacterium aquicola]REH01621.1 hypothetical protein C8P67_10199 [Flavobacterium aquicola]